MDAGPPGRSASHRQNHHFLSPRFLQSPRAGRSCGARSHHIIDQHYRPVLETIPGSRLETVAHVVLPRAKIETTLWRGSAGSLQASRVHLQFDGRVQPTEPRDQPSRHSLRLIESSFPFTRRVQRHGNQHPRIFQGRIRDRVFCRFSGKIKKLLERAIRGRRGQSATQPSSQALPAAELELMNQRARRTGKQREAAGKIKVIGALMAQVAQAGGSLNGLRG